MLGFLLCLCIVLAVPVDETVPNLQGAFVDIRILAEVFTLLHLVGLLVVLE
jgi:hypothetical protein